MNRSRLLAFVGGAASVLAVALLLGAGGNVTSPTGTAPDRYVYYPGTARQPPPQRGLPDPMSDFIKSGEWGPGFNAQNEMLDEHMKRYDLEDQDWRKQRPWYQEN